MLNTERTVDLSFGSLFGSVTKEYEETKDICPLKISFRKSGCIDENELVDFWDEARDSQQDLCLASSNPFISLEMNARCDYLKYIVESLEDLSKASDEQLALIANVFFANGLGMNAFEEFLRLHNASFNDDEVLHAWEIAGMSIPGCVCHCFCKFVDYELVKPIDH